jgi:hypothetical protein
MEIVVVLNSNPKKYLGDADKFFFRLRKIPALNVHKRMSTAKCYKSS